MYAYGLVRLRSVSYCLRLAIRWPIFYFKSDLWASGVFSIMFVTVAPKNAEKIRGGA